MSYHIVSIDTPQCSLSLRDEQLVCKTGDSERRLPLEDVASIIITSFSANLHSHLLLGAAKRGVSLIFCEAYKPTALLLPANRSTDTLLTRAVLQLPDKTRCALWQKTIDAKCQNQASLAKCIAPDDPRLIPLKNIADGKKPHKEAICAKLFWQILGRTLGDEDFIRERKREGLNSLLNFGYAVLLSSTLQKLYAVGLDPTFGLSHATRERSAPLAYDLMEPFRPCIDQRVYQWAKNTGKPWEVTKDYKQWVISFAQEKVTWRGSTLETQNVIDGVIRGFRRAIMENQPRHYRPWIRKS